MNAMKTPIGLVVGFTLLLALDWGCSNSEPGAQATGGSSCAPGQSECSGACVFTQSDPANCGACGAACALPEVCSLGACSATCAVGLSACSGACVDTLTHPGHCGGCGQPCAADQTCSLGTCVMGGGASSTGNAATGSGGTAGSSSTTGATTSGGEPLECSGTPTPGDGGLVIDGCCVALCAYGELTDANADGLTDGWGWEQQAECIVAGSTPAAGAAGCVPDPRSDLPEPGTGFWFPEVGDPPEAKCVRACDDPAADAVGAPDGDGWGWEYQDTCIVPGSRAAAEGIPCVPEGEACNGTGFAVTVDGEETCLPPCQYGSLTDVDEACMADGDGWGWEIGAVCLVPGSPAAPVSQCCDVPSRTGLPAAGSGYMADLDESGVFGDSADEICMPPCGADANLDDDCAGWGYEGGLSCIEPGSIAAAQLAPCVYEELTTDPPPGDGWDGDYTTTFFGEADCQSQGADDLGNTNLNLSACVSNGAVSLNGENQTWFGALGDLSSFWEGGQCTCPGAEPCIPGCPSDTCGRCFEVACNPGGTYYHPDDANQDTHNGLCRTDQSVVVELIDVCPHNHSNNPFWCTGQRPNHIDISCTAFSAISNGRQDIDNIGSLNAWVRPVDCSVGLGVKQIR